MDKPEAGEEESFAVGEIVVVKRYGQARIVEGMQTDASHQYHGRYLVEYLETGKTYYCRPEAIRKAWRASKRVVLCETTREYRAAVLACVTSADLCLEVGCHEGVTTNFIHNRCKYVVGVDKSEITVNAARAKHQHLNLSTVDAFDIAKLKALSPTGKFDKIFVDIGGTVDLHIIMSLAGMYFKSFKKSTLIVKSVHMKRFFENCEVCLDRI